MHKKNVPTLPGFWYSFSLLNQHINPLNKIDICTVISTHWWI